MLHKISQLEFMNFNSELIAFVIELHFLTHAQFTVISIDAEI